MHTHFKKILADTITPVSIYLKIRDKYPNSILLESSDYHANDNSFSYICFNPIASIKATKDSVTLKIPGQDEAATSNGKNQLSEKLNQFVAPTCIKFDIYADCTCGTTKNVIHGS